jgi:protein PhnA
MICEQAIDQIKKPSLIMADQWRHLGELIWSDIPAIQIMAYRLLKHISQREQWAREILDEAYLDEEILAEASKESL